MNIGQAIEFDEAGIWRWREILGRRCVLAMELGRVPRGLLKSFSDKHPKSHAASPGGYRIRMRMTHVQIEEMEAMLIRTIRQAAGEPLDFREITARARCEFNLATRKVLGRLINKNIVTSKGRGRAQVYWIRKPR